MTRDQAVQKLLDADIIKEGEARDIRTVLPPEATIEEVIGVLKFQNINLKPRDAASALGISVAEWNDTREVDARRLQVERKLREEYLAGPEGPPSWGWPGESASDQPTSEWGSEFGDGKERDKAMNALQFVIDEYDRLKSEGAFSQAEQSILDARFKKARLMDLGQPPSRDFVEGLVTDLQVNGATEEDMAPIRKRIPMNLTGQKMDPTEAAFLGQNQPRYQGITSLDPIQQAAAAVGASAVVDSSQLSSAERSFIQYQQANGIMQENQTVDTRTRLTFTGDETVFDRATGQTLSFDEWELIKTSKEAADIYQQRSTVSDAVQRLLDSGKFDGTTKRGSQYQARTVAYYNPATSSYEQRVVRDAPRQGRIPLEDLNIPTLAPTGAAWEGPTWDYKTGDGRAEWLGMSERTRIANIKLMADNGLLNADQLKLMQGPNGAGGNPLNLVAMDIWEQAVSLSSQFQRSPLDAIQAIGTQIAVTNAAKQASSGGGGRLAPTYSVPASLREIPDYKTLAQNTKQIFRGELGRNMEDWELKIYADELKRQNEVAQERRIGIHKQAWDEAIAGGTTDVDFTAVEDPNTALSYDIEKAYAGEIDRNQRVEDRSNTNRLLMNSITTGQRMI